MKNLILLTFLFLFSCKAESGYDISIDAGKSYPKKEINIQELADFEYIKLETTDKSLIGAQYFLNNIIVSQDFIVVGDKRQGGIMFFGRDGKFINSINHKGNGNGEYKSINSLVVDFDNKKVYVYDIAQQARLLVYSFNGDYLQTIKLGIEESLASDMVYDYDNDYLIAYNSEKLDQGQFVENPDMTEFPYLLISKADGSITPIELKVEDRFGNMLIGKTDQGISVMKFSLSNLYKNSKNTIISDFALDTVYTFDNHRLKPLLEVKKNNRNIMNAVTGCSDRYIFMDLLEKPGDEYFDNAAGSSFTRLFIDRATNEVCEIDKVLSNDGVEYEILTGNPHLQADYIHFHVSALKLVELYEEGKLSGEIEEIAASLKEDDNPVLVLAKFKE